jgi:Na+/melibiose symporter-like transporter
LMLLLLRPHIERFFLLYSALLHAMIIIMKFRTIDILSTTYRYITNSSFETELCLINIDDDASTGAITCTAAVSW